MKKETLGTIFLFIIAIIWGFAFVAVDYALENNWETFTILTCRGLIGGLLLLPFAIKDKFWKHKRILIHSIISGAFFFLGYALQTIGQQKTSVVNSAFYTCLYVIFTPFIVFIFRKNEVNLKTIISSFIAICGICMMSFFAKGEFSFHIGDLFLILCAFFFALQIAWVGHYLKEDVNPMTASSIMLLTMGLLSLCVLPFSNESFPLSFKGFGGVLFAAIFSSAVCSILQFYGQKHVSSSKSSIIMSLETPFACIFAVLLGQDKLNIYSIIGIVLMMISVTILNINFKKKYDFSKYKYLLLDVDDTLLDFELAEENAFKNLLHKLGVKFKKEYLVQYKKDNSKLWKRYELGEIERKTIFEERMKPLFSLLKIDYDPVVASYEYLELLSLESHLINETYYELERLSQKYDLYIISNGEPSVQYPRLEKVGIDKFFKGYFISEEIGYQKPKKEFFDYVCDNIPDFDKDKAIVVGDSLSSDMKGAIDYGIDTCWFNYRKKKTDLNINYEIDDLLQIK